MATFKAGYYIDELNEHLLELTSVETLQKLYTDHLYFNVEHLPDYIDYDAIPPSLKVAWNILSRGEPTRVSISLGEFILKQHLKENYTGIDDNKPEIKYTFNSSYFEDIEKNDLAKLLTNFSSYSINTAHRFGTKIYTLYQILFDLIISAQIQRTILISLFRNKENITFSFSGLNFSLQEAIISDINSLFNSLNVLMDDSEYQLPSIIVKESIKAVKISISKDEKNSIVICPFQKVEKEYYDRILTDRRIIYKELGKVIEEERDGRYTQRFEYYTLKQKEALIYFLKNTFRKRAFRAGQEAIINRAIQCKDVIGLLPTGGGKSLTFQICSLLHPAVTIVVDPINSLMKDQYDKLIDNGITKTAFINSFNTKEEREKNLELLAESKFLILFVSPERFQIEKFRLALGSCHNNDVFYGYAVIDEAHCVSEWGHDFRHTYLKLAQNLKRFCKPKQGELTLFGLTATASFDVLADVQRELEMPENAIISLPAEAIDRKELNFDIISISHILVDGISFYSRENELGKFKYPKIKTFIEQLPNKIQKLEKSYGYLSTNNDFFKACGTSYKNAGVIFCPTKSNKLKNGVLSLYDYLSNEKHLNIGTFFGGGDDDTIKDERIQNEAELSYSNQVDFIKNRKNLMIATKAFGMGIDKPNIRFSIHYSFPNSVESFYQEAGRAGRDGFPSICTIIYHPGDIQTNLDFYKNAFKGVDREKNIINELLDEVKYEDNFFLKVLQRQVQDKYPQVASLKLHNNRYIYLNGAWRNTLDERITIGNIDLERNLKSYDNATQNFDIGKANEIINYTQTLLKNECPDGNYLAWLKTKSSAGIKTQIESQRKGEYRLQIGFTNDIITKMTEVLVSIGFADFKDVIIRAAYNFTSSEIDFISNINYQYYKFQQAEYFKNNRTYQGFNAKQFSPNPDTEKYLLDNYYKIRNSSDTQRAIYRMSVVGIIDDYVIDYAGNIIEVRFKAKSEREYKDNFHKYLRRYLGVISTNEWLNKVDAIEDSSILRRVLYVLIEFIEEVIAQKRERSIKYMSELCEIQISQGEKEFRERIITYFTSKYAIDMYLPSATEKGTKESSDIVTEYISYIFNPPDGLGSQIDNAKHLRGACDNIRIGLKEDNASIDLLTSFAYFALDGKASDNLENALKRPLMKQAVVLYRKGFRRLLQKEDWNKCKALINYFNLKVVDINPVIKSLVTPLTNELIINRTTFRLNEFLNTIS